MRLILLIVMVSLSFLKINAQNQTENTSKAIPDIEKVYLHTDRTQYTLGEDLWYKAYMVYAYNHTLFDNSKLLYVELVSSESEIVSRHITKMEQGLGHGDFMLTDSLGVKPGKYQLRAYSNWNRNFGDDFIFKKEIEVVNLRADSNVDSEASNKETKKAKKETLKAEQDIDIQFFPEGGSLVSNVSSAVAFKATNKLGVPVDVQGIVFDKLGKQIALFKSRHHGMGKLYIKPLKDQEYYAEIVKPNGEKLRANLPKAQPFGYVLGVKKSKEKKIITIKTNAETLAKNNNVPITIIGTTRGVSYFEGTQALQNTQLSFILPEDSFPEGIAQITLYDEALKPYSERLVFIEKNHDLDVTLTTNKNLYSPKEKVEVSLSSKTKAHQPVLASYSLAVTEESVSSNNMNIASYFLMQSDIKGKIYNAQDYFDVSNSKRLYYLDLLLLTQGWRDFLWKKIPESIKNNKYRIEKEIAVSGRVSNRSGNKAKPNQNVNMVLTNKGNISMDNSVTNANGNFIFNNVSFAGLATLMLKSESSKGKNKNTDKNNGIIQINPIYRLPIIANYKPSPLFSSKKEETTEFKQHILKKYSDFNYQDTNLLDEVVITGKAKKKKPSQSIGTADHVYEIDEKTPHFSSMFQLLQFKVPGLFVSGGSIRFARFSGPPLILIEGTEIDMISLEGLNTDDIDRIESITSAGAAVYGSRGGNGVILIYTKEGFVQNKKSIKKSSSITKKIQGYQNTRMFYSPNYDDTKATPNKDADIRNTLYWNPYLHPDTSGNAKVYFFNSEVNNIDISITLEGVTSTGIPVVVKSSYRVED